MLNPTLSITALSKREKEIHEALLKGLPYKEIADKHFISLNTVKTHAKKIYSKLGIKNRIELLTAYTPLSQSSLSVE